MLGARTPEQALAEWSDEGDEGVVELEDYRDPDHTTIRGMADSNCILSGGFDEHEFKAALVQELREAGWVLDSGECANAAPAQTATSRRKARAP